MPKRALMTLTLTLALVGCGTGDPPRAAATAPGELFGGFERNIAGWVALGSAKVSRTTNVYRVGEAALQITAGEAAPYGAYAPNVAGRPSSGTSYRLSFWIRPSRQMIDGEVLVELTESGGRSPVENTASNVVRLRPGWQRVMLEGRLRARDRSSLSISLTQASNIFAGNTFYVDGLTLRLSG